MKTPLLLPATLMALIAGSVSVTVAMGQAPQGSPPVGGPEVSEAHPAPTHLKVLPKGLPGKQVYVIMDNWAGSLGVHCNTCHTEDPKNVGPDGQPRLNFADDSKPQKKTARAMYLMTEGINKDYVMKVDGAEHPVTCGTCHRGKLDPDPYVIPENQHGPLPGRPADPRPVQH